MKASRIFSMIYPQFAIGAAATVYGVGLTNQFASVFFSFFQRPVLDAERDACDAIEENKVDEARQGHVPMQRVAPAIVTLKTKENESIEKATESTKTQNEAQLSERELLNANDMKASNASEKNVLGRDDLKKIAGIGPKMEQVLFSRGVMTYADLAALSGETMQCWDQELGLAGRSGRDDWMGGASALAGS